MATTVTMPQLGETVTEGTILKWAKQVGDSIAEDEVLVEISTDKVDTEVPSPVAGTILEILVPEGETVGVGTELVVIGDTGEAPSASTEPADEPESEPEPGTTVESGGKPSEDEVEAFFAEPAAAEREPQLLSPVVRKLIRENDLDVAQIAGSGQGGRITRRDVEAHIDGAPAPAAAAVAPPPAEVPAPAPQPAEKAAPPPAVESKPEPVVEEPAAVEPAPAEPEPQEEPAVAAAAPAASGSEEVELSRLRVRIAENNIKARQTAAHVWTSVEVDFERVERVRQSNKDSFKAAEGFSLTYLPFISRATIDALKAYPVVNSSFDLEAKTATFHKKVDLGIAIDLNQDGLVVARVRNADGLRLVGIAREIADLARKGRDGKLGVDDLSGSTFTITNPGPFGSFMSAPIINVPNVAILSTDTITKRPTVVTSPDGQDMIAIRHIGYLGLSWDHRAFDGSTAVLFLSRIKENIETWDWEQELA